MLILFYFILFSDVFYILVHDYTLYVFGSPFLLQSGNVS